MCKIMCATFQEKSNNRIGHSKAKKQYQAKKVKPINRSFKMARSAMR